MTALAGVPMANPSLATLSFVIIAAISSEPAAMTTSLLIAPGSTPVTVPESTLRAEIFDGSLST